VAGSPRRRRQAFDRRSIETTFFGLYAVERRMWIEAPVEDPYRDVLPKLGVLERINLRFIQKTFEQPYLNRACTTLQRELGATWIDVCTQNVREVHGLEKLPDLRTLPQMLLVTNHRSFFDMYVVNALLYKAGFRQRFLFPVRAPFFYDHPLGFFVNGMMSFWSMYPPIFRDERRRSLNPKAFLAMRQALEAGRSLGIHPEGTRNRGDDPYQLLPPQPGVGRILYHANAPVIPAFINGLGNNILQQVGGNFTRKGERVILVFGQPIDLSRVRMLPASSRTYRQAAACVMDELQALGAQEKRLRFGQPDAQSAP
jgi:1-acyl-sn-glycerol-3-phosphate acyltransferase